MASRSLQRLSAIIKEKAAQIILYELKDPRLGFVTITRVKLAPDHSTCRIYYSVLGDEKSRKLTYHGLKDARGFVQRRLGKSLRTRTVPHVEFEYDESIEGSLRISSLLRETENERGEGETGDEGEGSAPGAEEPGNGTEP